MHNARAMPSAALFACLLLSACSAPKAPDEERRPDPQAQPKSTIVATANGYKDNARAAVTASQDAAKREQADLDAAAH